MTKSELIEILAAKYSDIPKTVVKSAVNMLLRHKIQSLANNRRIEIRGFGSFRLRYQAPRTGRNPKTGEAVALPGKYKIHFKAGKKFRKRVNEGFHPHALEDGKPAYIANMINPQEPIKGNIDNVPHDGFFFTFDWDKENPKKIKYKDGHLRLRNSNNTIVYLGKDEAIKAGIKKKITWWQKQ